MCNNKEKFCQSGTIPIGLSNHFLTYCTRKVSKGQFNKHNYAKIRSLKNYTKEDFILKLTCANLDQCFNACNINTAWSAFREILISILDSVAPVKEIRLKQRTEPWITSEILGLIKQRDNCLYQFKKSKDTSFLNYSVNLETMFKENSTLQNLNFFQIRLRKIKIVPESCCNI